MKMVRLLFEESIFQYVMRTVSRTDFYLQIAVVTAEELARNITDPITLQQTIAYPIQRIHKSVYDTTFTEARRGHST
jgi:hypothetical protein